MKDLNSEFISELQQQISQEWRDGYRAEAKIKDLIMCNKVFSTYAPRTYTINLFTNSI